PCSRRLVADLEQTGSTLAAADAHRNHRVLRGPPLSFDQGMTRQTRSTRSVRMAYGNGTAVDIQALLRDPKLVLAIDYLDSEGLIEFPEVDVIDAEPCL